VTRPALVGGGLRLLCANALGWPVFSRRNPMTHHRLTQKTAKYWIEKLQLDPHPEGGFFRQTYRSEMVIAQEALPAGFAGARAASTAIYFLLEGKNFSAFHRLRSDELWHFYAGAPLIVHVISREGSYSSFLLGQDLDAGQVLLAVAPAGCWFASHVADWNSFAVVGCTVAPGFDFEDFEMGKREELVERYPQHEELITRLTRE
jgi:predicted cupin superfamily sugar epimerase